MSRFTSFFIASEENGYRPPVLSYRAFLAYALILILLRLVLGILPAQSAAVESAALMNLINQERQRRNFGALLEHPNLLSAASTKAQDMIDRDYFAHVDPDGNYVWPAIIKAGYFPYKILGENLAIDFATAEGMVKAWIDSPTHRANLLHPEFIHQGLAALYGDYQGRYTNLTASLFGAPPTAAKSQTAAKKPRKRITRVVQSTSTTTTDAAPQASESPELTAPEAGAVFPQAYFLARILFTGFGGLLLLILAIDAVIILRHEESVGRSRSSYHLVGVFLLILVSILVWWW